MVSHAAVAASDVAGMVFNPLVPTMISARRRPAITRLVPAVMPAAAPTATAQRRGGVEPETGRTWRGDADEDRGEDRARPEAAAEADGVADGLGQAADQEDRVESGRTAAVHRGLPGEQHVLGVGTEQSASSARRPTGAPAPANRPAIASRPSLAVASPRPGARRRISSAVTTPTTIAKRRSRTRVAS